MPDAYLHSLVCGLRIKALPIALLLFLCLVEHLLSLFLLLRAHLASFSLELPFLLRATGLCGGGLENVVLLLFTRRLAELVQSNHVLHAVA